MIFEKTLLIIAAIFGAAMAGFYASSEMWLACGLAGFVAIVCSFGFHLMMINPRSD